VTRDVSLVMAGTTESVTVEAVVDNARAYQISSVSSIGLLGPPPILDTPYTVTVLPGALIANGQVKNFKEGSKYLPLVEFQEMQGTKNAACLFRDDYPVTTAPVERRQGTRQA
jgi:hypothetical protein